MNAQKCNICGGVEQKIIEADGNYNVVRCKSCGFVFLSPVPQLKFLTEHYNEEYFKPWLSEMRNKRIELFRKRWNKIKSLKTPGRILDIGCGPGEFLYMAKKDGWETYGTDISQYAARYASYNYGLKIYTGNLEEARFSDEYFDLITMWHVLEHLPDPSATLKEVKRILKHNGIFIVAVPNLNNWIYTAAYLIAKFKKPRLYTPGEREFHVSFFTPRTLRKILESAGFAVIKEAIDLGRTFWLEKIMDMLALPVFALSGINLGIAIEMHAVKKNEIRN